MGLAVYQCILIVGVGIALFTLPIGRYSSTKHVPNHIVLFSTVGGQATAEFSEDRSRLVVADQDQVKVIELKTETLFREFKAPFEVVGLAISSDNDRIAVGGQGRVAILDAKTGGIIKELARRD